MLGMGASLALFLTLPFLFAVFFRTSLTYFSLLSISLCLPASFLPPQQDVCAGIVLIEESGGRVVPSQCPSPSLLTSGPIPDADLGSRLYLAVRACKDTEGETGKQAQERLVREVWKRTEELEYKRPT